MAFARNSRVFRAITLLIIIVFSCSFAYCKVIYVDNDGQADFDNIQAGIDAAIDGDTVLVAPGEYVITEPITFKGKAITVQSENGRDETTIRMGTSADPKRGSVVIFENNETDASVLDGFTITEGAGSWVTSISASGGGGIFFDASSGTVSNCVIVQNRAKYGGGILCAYLCSPKLIDCLIVENSAVDSGGGVLVWSESSLTITNCIIQGNSATEGSGGISCWENASATMTCCTISENSANVGGGVFIGESSFITMSHCVITNNTAYTGSGGMETWNQSSADVINCVIARNTALGWGGGGVNCSIQGSATIINSIIWGNTAPKGREIWVRNAGTLSISHSNVSGGQAEATIEGGTINWGEGNIDTEPYFVDPSLDDFHLKSQAGRWNPNSQSWIYDDVTSPCIDVGDPNSPIGSEPFPNGGIINMGAYGGTAEASKSLSEKSIYIFMPGQSMVIQTGGIAGVNWTYTLTGQFQLSIDYGAGKAQFSNVEAIATGHSEPVRKLDPNDVFNLTGLTGTISKDGSIQFTGRTADESNVLLYLTLSDEWISLKGQTTPPPNSADFFIFDMDAVAQRKYGGGTGEIKDPYLIYTAEHLNAIGSEPNDWDKHFELMVDIDLSGYSYIAALIAADVDPCDPGFQGISFTGVLDGNGHKISNLTITSGDYVGLFGQTELGAEIKDLGITDVNITGSDYVGGFVGFSKGNISTSYCTGTISGDQRVGGITGRNWTNNITACYSTATITANSDAGGIVANNYGSITNCYNTGAISSYRDAAGLVGENYGTIDKCYSVGAVSGDSRPGGLVSYNWPDGGIVSGFWDVETSGLSTSDGGTGKTTTEMQTASTFLEADWDFVGETVNGTEDIWWVLEGQDYPRLWWEAVEQ